MKKVKEKFSFTTDFQLEVLRYIIRDPDGVLALPRVKPTYLTLIEHSVIAEGLALFFKKNNRVPGKAVLKETISGLLTSKNYQDLVLKEDIEIINSTIDNLYTQPLKDGDVIKEQIYKFSAYVEMKNLHETLDLENFGQYEEYHNKVSQIIQKANPKKSDEPLFMVADVVDRQFRRQAHPSVIPTPYKQINDLTNGGGYPKGSVIVLLDKAKAKKTFTLINTARGYLRTKKNVLYIDTENGKNEIMGRMIQSTLNKTKMDLNSGEFDKLEQKHVRKYKRIGVEFIVERVNAMIDDCNTIKALIDKLEKKHGIKIHVLVIDYAAKLASNNRDKDDNDRLFNVYVDISNLAHEKEIEHVWTANHITREGSKHRQTKYEENDIAGGISIIRNAEAVWGLNSTEEEEENNIQRMELVVQRDGKPHGRALFNVSLDTQRMVEFNKQQREIYDKEYGSKLEKEFSKKKKNDNASEDKQKSVKDI
jgi:KaiC/GvpD/RAD55 family RecA-like ATPase